MDIKKVIEERRSARSYEAGKEISDAQLAMLFGLVKLTPSSYNLQPWEFIVARSEAGKKKLAECATSAQPHVNDASATIIVLGNTDPTGFAETIAEDRMKKGTMDEEKKKRFLEVMSKWLQKPLEYRKIWALKNASLAAMTLMLAAHDMGLATCPMEGFDFEKIKKAFDVPEQYLIVMLITLGYKKKDEPPRGMRFGFEKIVHSEEFGSQPR